MVHKPLQNDSGGGSETDDEGGFVPTASIGGIELSEYLAFDRDTLSLTFRPVALLIAFVYAVWLAAFDAVIYVIEGIGTAGERLYAAATAFVTDLIMAAFGPDAVFEAAWVSARAEVLGAGIGGFAVAVAIVGATLYGVGSLLEVVR